MRKQISITFSRLKVIQKIVRLGTNFHTFFETLKSHIFTPTANPHALGSCNTMYKHPCSCGGHLLVHHADIHPADLEILLPIYPIHLPFSHTSHTSWWNRPHDGPPSYSDPDGSCDGVPHRGNTLERRVATKTYVLGFWGFLPILVFCIYHRWKIAKNSVFYARSQKSSILGAFLKAVWDGDHVVMWNDY